MFCVVERDLARHLREIDDEVEVPETDEECIDELASTFGVSESVATKAYYRSYKSFVDAAAWLEQYTADPSSAEFETWRESLELGNDADIRY